MIIVLAGPSKLRKERENSLFLQWQSAADQSSASSIKKRVIIQGNGPHLFLFIYWRYQLAKRCEARRTADKEGGSPRPSGRRSEAIGIGCGREDKPEPPIQLRKLLPRSLFHPLMDLFFLLAIRADEKEVLWDPLNQ